MAVTNIFDLDLNQQFRYDYYAFFVNQGDYQSRTIQSNLYITYIKDGTRTDYNLTDETITISYEYTNGNGEIQNSEEFGCTKATSIGNNVITFLIPNIVVENSGKVKAQVKIYEDVSTLINTTSFLFYVGKSISVGTIEDLQIPLLYVAPIVGSIPPSASTVGLLGQLYVDDNTSTLYYCTNITGSVYTWVAVSSGVASGGATGQALVKASSSNYDTEWATVLKPTDFEANTILAATLDNTPVALTVAEQTLVGRLTGGNIDDIAIGIADNNIVQIDHAAVADNDYAKFTANGLEGRSYSEVLSDIGAATSTQGALADTAVQPDSAIYTVTWDKGSSPTLTRVGRMGGATVLCGVDATPAVVSTVTISGTAIDTYDNYIKSSLFDWPEVTDIYGNVFIKIPKTYLGKTDGAGSKTWSASRKPFTGSYLPKCFWDFTNSRELDYVLVGKYPASLSTDTTKLESKPDVFPLVSRNIVQFRTLARANNTGGLSGYQQLDIHVIDLLQTLWIIQNATLHSQSKCAGFTSGQYSATHVATATESAANRIIVVNAHAELYAVGQTIGIGTSLGGNQIASNRLITSINVVDASNKAISFDGAAVTVTAGNILYNLAYKNGFSSLFASSYATKTSISEGKHSFVWNGIESLWGNIFQFVDGVNINGLQAWVCENADNYASNLFAYPYVSLSYANGGTNGYIKEIGYDGTYPYAAFPITVGGDYQTYYSDYYAKDTGQRVALVGGGWTGGAGTGLFYWSLDTSSSSAFVIIGSRLLKKPL